MSASLRLALPTILSLFIANGASRETGFYLKFLERCANSKDSDHALLHATESGGDFIDFLIYFQKNSPDSFLI